MEVARRAWTVLLLVAGPAAAQDAPGGAFSPPVPLAPTEVAPPPGAPPLAAPVSVRVRLSLGVDGRVTSAELLEGAGEPWDSAVLEGARRFAFEPARHAGQPVAVEIAFTQRFEPAPEPGAAPPEDAVAAPPPTGRLQGTVVERGTREAIAGAAVVAGRAGSGAAAETGPDGSFVLDLPPGRHRVGVRSAAHLSFAVTEEVAAGETLTVRYLVDRLHHDRYETVVVGRREREVVSRTRLSGRELTQVPGTFGDPFRVITMLPGVGQIVSLLPYPLVRGTSPGATGFLLDGVVIPLLFHLGNGPAVVHPEFIDEIDFYPGGFPVEYGPYTGGVADAHTRAPRPAERRLDIDLNLLSTGVFARGGWDALGVTGTLAGRYGTPSWVMSLAQVPAFLDYWDYQARLDGRAAGGRWKVFSFGGFDEAGEVVSDWDWETGRKTGTHRETFFRTQFHRLDLRWRTGDERDYLELGLVGGWDKLLLGDAGGGTDEAVARPDPGPGGKGEGEPPPEEAPPDNELASWQLSPRLRLGRRLDSRLRLRAGLEATHRRTVVPAIVEEDALELTARLTSLAVFADTPFAVTEDLLLIPGVRVDVYDSPSVHKSALDPRFSLRWRAGHTRDGEVWLKGHVGLYNQPPRFFVPVPGLEDLALQMGLLRTVQTGGGVELSLPGRFFLDLQVFYHHLDPVILDIPAFDEQQPADETVGAAPDPDYPGVDLPREPSTPDQPTTPAFLERRRGRAYGLEVLLKRLRGEDLFGWVSYTLSVSEREGDAGWVPFAYDRAHMLHLVAGYQLPRQWDVGAHFQVQSGRPSPDPYGRRRRLDPFFRLNLRIDRRAVWDQWMLDFYVDVINVTLAREEISEEMPPLPLFLPTFGFRGVI